MKEELAIQMILFACESLKWELAFPDIGEEDTVPGMVIGKSKYITDVIKGKYANEPMCNSGIKVPGSGNGYKQKK